MNKASGVRRNRYRRLSKKPLKVSRLIAFSLVSDSSTPLSSVIATITDLYPVQMSCQSTHRFQFLPHQSLLWKLSLVKLISSRYTMVRCSCLTSARAYRSSRHCSAKFSRKRPGRYLSCRTFFRLSLFFKQRRRKEVTAIFLFGNFLWNRMHLSLSVFPDQFSSVFASVRNVMCLSSSIRERSFCFLFLFVACLQICCT